MGNNIISFEDFKKLKDMGRDMDEASALIRNHTTLSDCFYGLMETNNVEDKTCLALGLVYYTRILTKAEYQ